MGEDKSMPAGGSAPDRTVIRTLRREAGAAGDLEMVAICDRALDGDADAVAECRRVILAVRRASKRATHPRTLRVTLTLAVRRRQSGPVDPEEVSAVQNAVESLFEWGSLRDAFADADLQLESWSTPTVEAEPKP